MYGLVMTGIPIVKDIKMLGDLGGNLFVWQVASLLHLANGPNAAYLFTNIQYIPIKNP